MDMSMSFGAAGRLEGKSSMIEIRPLAYDIAIAAAAWGKLATGLSR